MKQYLHISLLVAFLCMTGCKDKKEKSSTVEIKTIEIAEVPNEDEVASIVTELYDAMIDRNKELLENLCSNQLTYGHSSGRIENKKQFIDDVTLGTFDYLSISPENQTIYLSGNTAVVRHIFVVEALDDGKPIALSLGCIQIYQKQTGAEWKLLSRQAYKL